VTRIVAAHRLAHRAALAVSAVLERAGALTEPVKNDYGEDLLVQTQLQDAADSFHILIQVKGYNLKEKKNGKYSISVDVSHLHRWVSHIVPVLVCVFDSTSEKIFAFYPRKTFSLWDLATTRRNYLTVEMGKENIFSEGSAIQFIWTCRIEYFSRMLAWQESHVAYSIGPESAIKRNGDKDKNIIVFHFLKSIGFFESDEVISPRFRAMVSNASVNFSKINKENSEEHESLGLRHVFMLSTAGFVEETTSSGMPLNLLECATDMIGEFFKRFHRDEWANAATQIKDNEWLSPRSHSASRRGLGKRINAE
jgi:hypothetical protein